MINLNSKTNQKQFIARKIKVESVLELVNLRLVILWRPINVWHKSIIKQEDTLITNIKIIRINNHVLDSMVMITNGFRQKNGKYGRLKWINEGNEW
jgi:hypothetical protein